MVISALKLPVGPSTSALNIWKQFSFFVSRESFVENSLWLICNQGNPLRQENHQGRSCDDKITGNQEVQEYKHYTSVNFWP